MPWMDYVVELGRTVMDKDPAATSLFASIFFSAGVRAQAYHYLAYKAYHRGWMTMASWLGYRARRITGIEIHPAATLGRRVLIDHGAGLVIGATAIVGDEVTLYHGVTLGGRTLEKDAKRHPTIEDGVVVGAGATVLGNITIGRCAKVGANSVVLKDVPAYATAVGSPAEILFTKKRSETQPPWEDYSI